MDVELLSAAAVVLLLAGFLWWTGAPRRQLLTVLAVAIMAMAATALVWNLLLSGDS